MVFFIPSHKGVHVNFVSCRYAKVMKSIVFCGLLFSLISNLSGEQEALPVPNASTLDKEVTIVGGGIAGALHAYHAHRQAQMNNEKVRVTICEKNKSIVDTTTLNIVFSLSPDEILAVIPRGRELMRKLQVAFNEPGGLRVFNDRNTTTANIVPSLTPDEILSVVPRGKALVKNLQCAFN